MGLCEGGRGLDRGLCVRAETHRLDTRLCSLVSCLLFCGSVMLSCWVWMVFPLSRCPKDTINTQQVTACQRYRIPQCPSRTRLLYAPSFPPLRNSPPLHAPGLARPFSIPPPPSLPPCLSHFIALLSGIRHCGCDGDGFGDGRYVFDGRLEEACLFLSRLLDVDEVADVTALTKLVSRLPATDGRVEGPLFRLSCLSFSLSVVLVLLLPCFRWREGTNERDTAILERHSYTREDKPSQHV